MTEHEVERKIAEQLSRIRIKYKPDNLITVEGLAQTIASGLAPEVRRLIEKAYQQGRDRQEIADAMPYSGKHGSYGVNYGALLLDTGETPK